MAKIRSPWVGQGSGKLGDGVYYRIDGKQYARARAVNVANPRTDAQLTTRVLLKTASTAYSLLSANFGNQTFQGKKIGAENQRAFVAANMAYLRQRINNGQAADCNFAGKNTSRALYNRYIVSDGNLSDVGLFVEGNALVFGQNVPADPSYQQVCDALGVPAGSQLTFLIVLGNNQPNGVFGDVRLNRIVLAPAGGNMSDKFFVDGAQAGPHAINNPNPANDVSLMNSGQVAEGKLGFPVAALGTTVDAAACVTSYLEGATWRYSHSQLFYAGTGYWSLQDAIDSFKASESAAVSNEYTRQATSETASVYAVTSVFWKVSQEVNGTGSRVTAAAEQANGDGSASHFSVDSSEYEVKYGTGDDQSTRRIIETRFYGNLPKGLSLDNFEVTGLSPFVFDESVVEEFRYINSSMSYYLRFSVGGNAAGDLVIKLNDEDGNQLGQVYLELEAAPLPSDSISLYSANLNGRDLTINGNHIGVTQGETASLGQTGLITASSVDSNRVVLALSFTGQPPVDAEATMGNGLIIKYHSQEGGGIQNAAVVSSYDTVIVTQDIS